MKKRSGFVCASVVAFIFASIVAAAHGCSDTLDSERGDNRSAFQICSGTIEVGVRITNEDGDSVSGVLVDVSHVKVGLGGFTTERKNEQAVADGNFHIRKTDICGLTLHFSKPGFYGETLEYSVIRDVSNIGNVLDLDRIVVLKLRPTPAPVERIEGILKTNVTGPKSVVRLQPGILYASQVNNQKQGELDSLGDFCFLKLRFEDGRIVSVRRTSQSGGIFDVPKGAALGSSGKADGFVLFQPQNEYTIARRAFREMRVAPEGGYLPQIEIPEDSGDRVYFYCFLGGKYGKGFVVRPTLKEENGETTAVSVVRILVNPTGDRNVATLD